MSKRKSTSGTKGPKRSAKKQRAAASSSRVRNRKTKDAGASSAGVTAPTVAAGPKMLTVGIGASAGGLEALEELLGNMPADTGMGFVVVTHQHPSHTSMLPELLSKSTMLPVKEAADGIPVQPNHVYIGPPGGHLAIYNGTLHRMETGSREAPRLPIDYFFRSLAADQKEKAVCIVLSGTGTDGTLGLRAIKAELGMVMVQQAQSAKYAGMPSSAIATGLADFILPAAEMAKQLVGYARSPYLTAAYVDDEPVVQTEPLQKIFVMLRARTGHDFSAYKANTIRRRIERRMSLHQIKGPAAYLRYLQDNAHEIDILFKELLIGVTSFFRDTEAFEMLAKVMLPELLKSRPDDYTLRIWVPGCASGEEAFSLAILLRECIETLKRHFEVQIFATDLDSEAIDVARMGQYPDGIAVDVSPERLARFFVRDGNAYRIRKEIRDMTIFAVQNVVKDAPFTKLDLISCRNLLIYLNTDVQKRLLPIFHYALKPGGLLFLGPSETIGPSTDLFEVVDKRWKVFRRKETLPTVQTFLDFSSAPLYAERELRERPALTANKESANISTIVERLLLGRYAPASVVVNDRGDAVYIHGRTGAFLEPAAGKPRLNILDMAREGLQLELASALRQAAGQSGEVVREAVRVRTNGDVIRVDVSVSRIQEPEALRGLILVTFLPKPVVPEPKKSRRRGSKDQESERAEDLERELQSVKESLQTTIEELETSNEELKSTNEELQSTNEELQSSNEELETSKEEMQSLNEELTTVNAELQSKVEELSRANDDMQNLLNSTEIATIFLDNQLKITRFTEQAKSLVHLIQTDVGRPLSDLVSTLNYEDMVADCREVLRTLVFKQTEVQTKSGQWFLLRIMPYRTAENVIDGLVLTFVDINPVKAAQQSLRRMSKVFTDGLDPIIIVDLEGRIVDVNNETVSTYGWMREDLIGQSIRMMVPPTKHDDLEQRLERCRQGKPIRSVECLRVDKAGRELRGLVTLMLLTDENGKAETISMTIQDISA